MIIVIPEDDAQHENIETASSRLKTADLWKGLVAQAAETLPDGKRGYGEAVVYMALHTWLSEARIASLSLSRDDDHIAEEISGHLQAASEKLTPHLTVDNVIVIPPRGAEPEL